MTRSAPFGARRASALPEPEPQSEQASSLQGKQTRPPGPDQDSSAFAAGRGTLLMRHRLIGTPDKGRSRMTLRLEHPQNGRNHRSRATRAGTPGAKKYDPPAVVGPSRNDFHPERPSQRRKGAAAPGRREVDPPTDTGPNPKKGRLLGW